jgi:hypothetical protein
VLISDPTELRYRTAAHFKILCATSGAPEDTYASQEGLYLRLIAAPINKVMRGRILEAARRSTCTASFTHAPIQPPGPTPPPLDTGKPRFLFQGCTHKITVGPARVEHVAV